ncbi:MAG: Unknown protein [uncultured Sulfurovum sp.]|uniref:Uncharacterized protein n=1 Tax=uncultured Sulfurovum sp. TaxID=269237 RepID=A0A6S6T135_9BACT|nr:MAG: Unknown protein [uncultured Sulfurovum sp.]
MLPKIEFYLTINLPLKKLEKKVIKMYQKLDQHKTGVPAIELPLLYLILSVVIFFIGAGKYSLDEQTKKD